MLAGAGGALEEFVLAEEGEQFRVVDEQVELVLGLGYCAGGGLRSLPGGHGLCEQAAFVCSASRTCCSTWWSICCADGRAGGAEAGSRSGRCSSRRGTRLPVLRSVCAGDLQRVAAAGAAHQPAQHRLRGDRVLTRGEQRRLARLRANSARVNSGSCASSLTNLPLRACPR